MLSFEDNDDDGCDSISKGSGSSSSISRRKRPYLPGSQCRAWRFQLMVRANLCNASTAVEKGNLLLEHLSLRTGHNMPKCVTGVVVFCDRSLFSQPPESDGLVSIEMRGYVQARQATRVVYIGGLTPVKIFFRLRLQNLFPGVCPPMIAECKWLAVVL